MVNKTKSFPKLTPTSWHKPVCLSEIQTNIVVYIVLYGKLWVSLKKGINKICKGNVFFYKYVHIIFRLQMKTNVFFHILKQIMYSKIYTFFNVVFTKTLRDGYILEVEGQIQTTSLS